VSRPDPRSVIGHAAVVLPVRDEERLLPAALDAVERAADRARATGVTVDVVVVLDSCTDGSARVCAARAGVVVRHTAAGRVGAARAAGCGHALATSPVAPGRTWLACTDADSVVPQHWLVHHLRLAGAGADAVLGTVRVPDWRSWPGAVRTAYDAAYHGVEGHPHVHGANLGVRGNAYRAAGGFGPVAADEDVALVAALRRGGHRVVSTARAAVATSARAVGRAPAGFSGRLATLAAQAGAEPSG